MAETMRKREAIGEPKSRRVKWRKFTEKSREVRQWSRMNAMAADQDADAYTPGTDLPLRRLKQLSPALHCTIRAFMVKDVS